MKRQREGGRRRSASTSVIVAHFGSGRGSGFQVTPTRVLCVYAPLLTRHNSSTKSCPNLEGSSQKLPINHGPSKDKQMTRRWAERERWEEVEQEREREIWGVGAAPLSATHGVYLCITRPCWGEDDGHKVILNGTPPWTVEQAFKFDDALVDDDAAWRWRWRWRWNQVPSGTSWLTAQKGH